MNARAQTPRRYNHVDVCLQCGGIATSASPDCAHARVSKVELTPTVKRALTQLRGARSYVRYLTERFNEMVQLELLAQAEVPAEAGTRRGRKNAVAASDVPVAAIVDERQVSLFG